MGGVLLVTGGARGIGAATVRLAAKQGYAVAINYRERADAAEALAQEAADAGVRAVAVRADVADEAAVVRMFETVDDALGPVTALVNSAGIGGGDHRVADMPFAVLDELFRINVIGTMLCCREAVRRMSTRLGFPDGGRGGAIVNVSSMAATIGGRPRKSHYAASKAAVDAFTVGLAKEVAAEGIRVNSLRPGVTLTDMTAAVRDDPAVRAGIADTIAMRRPAEADEIARPILFLLSGEASFVSGARLDASGGGFTFGGHESEPGARGREAQNRR